MAGCLWIDAETRSHCDLKVKGVYNYAAHPTTEVLCLSYAFDNEDVRTWTPPEPLPTDILEWKGQIRAHNAAFERLIFWRVLGINYALEQFYCTAAQARANCAPGSLEDAGRFAGADMQKDHRGAQLIRKLCVPPYVEDEALKAELIAYCEQDVRAMRALSQSLRDLTPEELADYHTNERINDKGVMVDTRLCRAAVRYAEAETEDIQARVVELTEGAVTSVRSPKMREWVLARLGAEARALCVKGDRASLDKSVRANLLAFDNPEQVPPEVREVVECADDLWASSVAKFQRLADLADRTDHRVRGAFVFAGGAATGRAASYGAQVHNFPRKAAKSPEAVRADMVAGQPIVPVHGRRVTDVLRSMLRPALIPAPGHVFVVADWAAIEGRVNPWLAGTDLGERKLDIYRRGDDIYKVNAAATFGVRYDEVSDEQRQVGKVQELALGFAGGVGAFAAMGRGYGVQVPEHAAKQMVRAWRLANPWAVRWWHDLEGAYTSALRHPGREFTAGRVVYIFEPPHLWYMLPSGRILCYPFARFEQGGISYAKASWTPAADAKEWPRARLWTGTACIAKGTPVLTKRGWVAIEKVLVSDAVWDGVDWVAHDGVAYQGVGRVNFTFGVAMTPDHKVLTNGGWRRADQTEGYQRASCRLPDGYQTNWLGRAKVHMANFMRLRADQSDEAAKLHEISSRGAPSIVRLSKEKISFRSSTKTRHESSSGVCGLAVNAGALSNAFASSVEKLRRAGHHCLRTVETIFREFLGGYGRVLSTWALLRPDRQRRPIHRRKLSMGDLSTTSAEYTKCSNDRQPVGANVGVRAFGKDWHRRDNATIPIESGRVGRRFDSAAELRTEVFDLINCGPRARFVVQSIDGKPLIVHNCENVTQAAAHDLLRGALRRLPETVLHVHDEIVLEVPEADADAAARLVQVMCEPPAWAEGLPLKAEVKVMRRYGKG